MAVQGLFLIIRSDLFLKTQNNESIRNNPAYKRSISINMPINVNLDLSHLLFICSIRPIHYHFNRIDYLKLSNYFE